MANDNLNAPVEYREWRKGKWSWGFGEYFNYDTEALAQQAQERLRQVVNAALNDPPLEKESEAEYTARMTRQFPFTA